MTGCAIAELRRRELKSGLFVKLHLTVRKSDFPFLLCFKKKKGSSALAPMALEPSVLLTPLAVSVVFVLFIL